VRKEPLGWYRFTIDDSTEMHLGEVEWGRMNWINFQQDRERGQAVLNTVVNLWIL